MVSSGDGKRRTTVAGAGKDGKLGGGEGELVLLPLNVNLPRVMVDGCVLVARDANALWQLTATAS